MTSLVVLHDIGDIGGGDDWTSALEGAGWPGLVTVPDLPGHGRAAAPTGGDYELPDAVMAIARSGIVTRDATVMGVGANGWAAQILALAGRAASLVLVDGLGGPWVAPAETIRRARDWLRAIADDPGATGPAPAPPQPDPRLRHGLVPHGSRDLAYRAAAAMPVPVLLIETPASPIDPVDAQDLADGAGWTLVRADSAAPDGIASIVVEALYGISTTRPNALRSSM